MRYVLFILSPSLAGRIAAFFLILLAPPIAFAAEGFSDIGHLAFVTQRDAAWTTVIDTANDRIAGRIDLGLVPSQTVISPTLPVLAAIDGVTNRFVLVDLSSERIISTALSFPARRLLVSPDGRKVGVSDLTGGHVAVFSLPDGRMLANIPGLPPLSDLMFSGDGTTLAIAGEGLNGLGIIDLAQGKMAATLPASLPPTGGIASITRSANGRQAFTRATAGSAIGVVDLKAAKPLAQIDTGHGAVTATPSGTGAYLLLANETKGTFSIIHGDDLSLGAELPAAPGMTATYSGWFDSVAFVPSTNRHALLVFDLWRMAKGSDIALPANPGPGTVTADGAKLYLPIEDKNAVAVIDTRNRRLSSLIALDGRPTAVVVAAGFGICH